MDKHAYLSNADPAALDAVYQQYLKDPASVDPGWARFFEGFELARTQHDLLPGVAASTGAGSEQLTKEFKVIELINAYRQRGHLFTRTNPVRERRKYSPPLDLPTCVQGITDLITTPGLINLAFADVKSVMHGAGSALMGIGSARGADRAIKAAELAVASPLLEASIDGAHGVLLSIQGGSNLGIFEINDAARLVQEAVHPEANIIFGAVIDDTLGDEVRVTVIAAGFDGGEPTIKTRDARRTNYVVPESSAPVVPSADEPLRPPEPSLVPPPIDRSFDDDEGDLDIPDFLK